MAKKPRYFPIKRVVGMIVLATIFTISWAPNVKQFVSDLVLQQFPSIPKDINWFAIVSAVLFLGFVIWALWDLSNKLEESENKKPNISVEREYIKRNGCLKITNKGEQGNFEVQISMLAELQDGQLEPATHWPSWKGVWYSTKTNKIEIQKDHHEHVILARASESQRPIIELPAYDASTRSVIIEHFIEFDSGNLKQPLYKLSVNISSDPSPKGGAFKQEYIIDAWSFAEANIEKKLTGFRGLLSRLHH